MKILIIVPARAGSVGIKNKNLIKIYDKHLIEYTLDFIKKTKLKNVLISSDSKKILNLCKLKGFSTDYLRPKNISKSNTSMYTTVNHGLEWVKKKYKHLLGTTKSGVKGIWSAIKEDDEFKDGLKHRTSKMLYDRYRVYVTHNNVPK